MTVPPATRTPAPATPLGGLDTWIAFLAGDQVWRDDHVEPTVFDIGLAWLMLNAAFVVMLTHALALADRVRFDNGLTSFETELLTLSGLGLVALAAISIRPIGIVRGRLVASAPFGWSLLWRTVAYGTLLITTVAVVAPWRFLAGIPLALLAVPDALLSAEALGIEPSPRRWLWRLVLSTLHFGVLGAMLATALFSNSADTPADFLSLYVGMWIGAFVLVGAVWVVGRWRSSAMDELERQLDDTRHQERQQRAHWLHDDVLSEVRLTTLRVEGGEEAGEQTRRELHDLDYRLRLRQLEESMRGGTPHVYEILQPHIRRLQHLGVRLTNVPPLETTQIRIDETSGNLVHRALSNLISNALNAGAGTVGIALQFMTDPDRIAIAVTDDAGGFDLDTIPGGRGLTMLRDELGPHSVTRADTDDGSRVVVAVPISGPFDHDEIVALARLTRALPYAPTAPLPTPVTTTSDRQDLP